MRVEGESIKRRVGEMPSLFHGLFKEEVEMDVPYFLLIAILMVISLVVQDISNKSTPIPSPLIPIFAGACTSGLFVVLGMTLLQPTDPSSDISEQVFFYLLLPPIIFSSGFHVKRKLLFGKMLPIFMLAIVATAISVCLVASLMYSLSKQGVFHVSLSLMECIAFASLISSVDPISALAIFKRLKVDKNLFYLLLGESLLNDAIAVTVFRSANNLIGIDQENLINNLRIILCEFLITFFVSIAIGYVLGFLFCLLFKYDVVKDSQSQIIVICILAYVPFLLAESLKFSGIVAILFTGIVTRQYLSKNLTPSVRMNISFIFKFQADFSETLMFLLLGLNFFHSTSHFNFIMIILTFFIILAARGLSVFPSLGLANFISYLMRNVTGDYSTYFNDKERADGYELAEQGKEENNSEIVNIGGESIVNIGGESKMPTVVKKKSVVATTEESRQSLQKVHKDNSGVAGIPCSYVTLVAIAGLRGAISYGLANSIRGDHKEIMMSTTSMIILLSIIFQGGMIESAIDWLQIASAEETEKKTEYTEDDEKIVEITWEERNMYPLFIKKSSSTIHKILKESMLSPGLSLKSPVSSGGGSDISAHSTTQSSLCTFGTQSSQELDNDDDNFPKKLPIVITNMEKIDQGSIHTYTPTSENNSTFYSFDTYSDTSEISPEDEGIIDIDI